MLACHRGVDERPRSYSVVRQNGEYRPREGSINRVVRFISQARTHLYTLLATPRVYCLFTI